MTSPTPRKKLSPAPLRRASDVAAPRALAPSSSDATVRRSLPTASALQAALASAMVMATLAAGATISACGSATQDDSMNIAADRRPAQRDLNTATTIGSPPGVGTFLEPSSMRTDGEMPPVLATVAPTTTVKPPIVKPPIAVPTVPVVTGGAVAPVMPSTHPPMVKGGAMRVAPKTPTY